MSESQTTFAEAGAAETGHAPDDGVDVQIDDAGSQGSQRQERPAADRTGDEFGRRANRRILNLLGQAKAAEARAAALERENAQLRHGALLEGKGRLTAEERAAKAEMDQTQRELRIARDAGDTDAEMKAQGRLTQLAVDAGQIARDKAQWEQAASRVPQAPATPTDSAAMRAWRDENEWFQSDQAMTQAGIAFHADAVGRGLKAETPEYFKHIDRQMRRSFPEYFEEGGEHVDHDEHADVVETPQRQTARPLVSAAAPRRNTPGAAAPAPRTIRLTADERSTARSLGITDQAYAAAKVARANGARR